MDQVTIQNQPSIMNMTHAADMQLGPENLEALFDNIVQHSQRGASNETVRDSSASSADSSDESATEKMLSRVGQMTRALHDNLRELGYDKMLEKATSAIPDACDRLSYVATMTEQAAQRVLNATDVAQPIQDRLAQDANGLSTQWRRLYERQLSLDEFKDLAGRTRAYLDDVPSQTGATNKQLLEIMMAQDFQDLTGQVIKKITDMVQTLERELVQLLLDNIPPEKRADSDHGLLNGPVINPKGRSDVVTGQNQVDDLLESLGF